MFETAERISLLTLTLEQYFALFYCRNSGKASFADTK